MHARIRFWRRYASDPATVALEWTPPECGWNLRHVRLASAPRESTQRVRDVSIIGL
jgi:hypothetical protein